MGFLVFTRRSYERFEWILAVSEIGIGHLVEIVAHIFPCFGLGPRDSTDDIWQYIAGSLAITDAALSDINTIYERYGGLLQMIIGELDGYQVYRGGSD